MLVELVRVKTSDGVALDGIVHPAASGGPLDLDAAIIVHGVGGTFFSGSLFDPLRDRLLAQGVTVARINTRGHSPVNWLSTDGGPLRGGAAYEVVDHCRHDLAAWTDLLVERGCRRILLLGHSLGAIKAVYAAAHQPCPFWRAVIALSPPRLSYAAFQQSGERERFLESLRTAEELLAAGRGDQVFSARFPFPLLITAAAYLDKYGPAERYNILRFVARISPPLLFTYGAVELERGGVAFAGLPAALRAALPSDASLTITEIPHADHFYNAAHEPLAAAVSSWLNQTCSITR